MTARKECRSVRRDLAANAVATACTVCGNPYGLVLPFSEPRTPFWGHIKPDDDCPLEDIPERRFK